MLNVDDWVYVQIRVYGRALVCTCEYMCALVHGRVCVRVCARARGPVYACV